MQDFKNVAPLSDFDWNAFENGTAETQQTQEELEKAYDQTLCSAGENAVAEGTVIAVGKRAKLSLTSASRAMVSSP